jgi:hypothetical protein
MSTTKNIKKNIATRDSKTDITWRKPIVLDDETEVDPLALLYRGRAIEEAESDSKKMVYKEEMREEITESAKSENSQKDTKINEKTKANAPVKPKKHPSFINNEDLNDKISSTPAISDSELKAILKIKSETFIFTDIREILRGKSLEIYAYLRYLSGEQGVCKIKHQELMKILDISRPTLFKQGDWLSKLSLIEKRNVPGDHLGTSYTVHRLEDILPVSEILIRQLQTAIDSFTVTWANKNPNARNISENP